MVKWPERAIYEIEENVDLMDPISKFRSERKIVVPFGWKGRRKAYQKALKAPNPMAKVYQRSTS
jgi:hypothetical protein